MASTCINCSCLFFFLKSYITQNSLFEKGRVMGATEGKLHCLRWEKLFLNTWLSEPRKSTSCEGSGPSKDSTAWWELPVPDSPGKKKAEVTGQQQPPLRLGTVVSLQWHAIAMALHTLLCSQNSSYTSSWGDSGEQKQGEGMKNSLDIQLTQLGKKWARLKAQKLFWNSRNRL